MISRDEEDTIHEDELILLDDILSRTSGVNKEALQDILTLTFLNEEDYTLIKASLIHTDFMGLIKLNVISPLLRFILNTLQKNKGIPHKILLQQHTSRTDGNRYRWRARMNTPTQELGTLSVRKKGTRNILGQPSFYIVRKGKNGQWIIGDHQMAFGFGLNAGKPFAPRKGWSTVNKGAALYSNGLNSYRSSTGLNRTRGVALEQTTPIGAFYFSHGQGGTKASTKKGLSRGAWQLEKNSFLGGAVVTQKSQSIFASYEWEKINVGGEIAIGRSNPSMVLGMNYRIRPFKYLLQIRNIYAHSLGVMGNPMVEWAGAEVSERGLFQGAIFRVDKIKIMIYSDTFYHHTRKINGYEFGLRSETKLNRNRIVFQYKTEKKDSQYEIVYAPLISSTYSERTSFKLEHRFSTKFWRTDVKYQFVSAGEIETNRSHGLDLRVNLFRQSYKVELDWMVANVGSFNSRLYFWDVNLPGEMLTRLMARSSHSQGVKVIYPLSNGSKLGFKTSMTYASLSFNSSVEISGGIFIQVTL